MFTTTFTHRDDWLHRGIMLRDMDYYHYARYMQRVEMPRLGSAANFQKKHGAYFLFDTHYPLARSYVQILRKKPCTVQNVGPHCKRSEVNGGEDNAVYQLDVPVYTEIAFPLLVTISETQSHWHRLTINPDSYNFDPHEVWIFMKSNPLEALISCKSIFRSHGFHEAHAFWSMDVMKSELLGTRTLLNPKLRRLGFTKSMRPGAWISWNSCFRNLRFHEDRSPEILDFMKSYDIHSFGGTNFMKSMHLQARA